MTTILVGVDGSPEAVVALRWALDEAVRRQATVTALCAWQPVPYGAFGAGMAIPPMDVDNDELHATSMLDQTVKAAREAVPAADKVLVTARAALGPAPQVLEEASRQVDLVVVGSRPSVALRRAIGGSTSSAVLHHAHCPVVVVAGSPSHSSRTGRIVVGFDGAPAARAALRWAVEEGDLRDCPVTAVYARPRVADRSEDVDSLANDWLSEQLTEAGAAATTKPELRLGDAGEELVRGLTSDDLLVLGSRGRGALRGWLLGSTSTFAIHHALCPVAVIREPAVNTS